MRISDWSSDVCSSDLSPTRRNNPHCGKHWRGSSKPFRRDDSDPPNAKAGAGNRRGQISEQRLWNARCLILGESAFFKPFAQHRSEEHTSELQSLMRISYAVFCLKKKTTTTKRNK